ncbi:MAG: ABC transporter substrate-binding protein [Bacilli bacterium]
MKRATRALTVAMTTALSVTGVAAPMAFASTGSAPVTITLEGPNQWNNSGTSFGPAWTNLIRSFEKANPGIKVNVKVLPLSSFNATESAQIAAGTAPQIMFNQYTAKAEELTPLTKYLNQPNPYVRGNKKWLNLFNSDLFNLTTASATGDPSNYYNIPVNIFIAGLFYNKTDFQKSGITKLPATFQQFLTDLGKLKKHGYIPFGATQSQLTIFWTFGPIVSELLAKYYPKWDVYTSTGRLGHSASLNTEDYTRAVLTGELNWNKTPQLAESLVLLKELSKYFTPNWSGITDNSGAAVDIPQFITGKAAIVWGTDFGYGTVHSLNPKLNFASMPLPPVEKDSTPLSTGAPAEFGSSIGGTTYNLPATDKGAKLAAAIKFLQYFTSPSVNQKWLAQSSGNSPINGAKNPTGTAGMQAGAWGKSPRVSAGIGLSPQQGPDFIQYVEGYLLGTASLSQTLNNLQQDAVRSAHYAVQQNRAIWGNQPWYNDNPQ